MSGNLYHLLESGFPSDGSEIAIQRPDGSEVSYAGLERLSACMAQLLEDSGVEKGGRVLVQVEKSAHGVALYLACLRAGAVYLPLNTGYTVSELEYFVADSTPTVIVCDPSRADAVQAFAAEQGAAQLFTLDADGKGTIAEAAAAFDGRHACVEAAPDDLAAILYTSGTTGRPKGAMLSHGNLSSNALSLHELWGFVPGDVVLHALPIFHVHGLFVALHCALLNGSRMLFLPRFDSDVVIRLLPQATVMMGVPTFYTRLLAHSDFSRDVCRRVRLFISGSAPLLEETFQAFEARCGHHILERYGMTEAGMIASNPLYGQRIPATVGYPLPGVYARVVDESGNLLPNGEVGGLEIKGPNVFKGYWGKPEKTKEDFRSDGFFMTGDLARIDKRGRISIVGRSKDMIISGGYNVYPKEVEEQIDAIDGVGESAVVGVPHRDFGEGVIAVVTRDASRLNLDAAALIDNLADSLARFKQPKRIFFVDDLPRNAMGKVQKNVLRKQYESCFGE